VIILIGTHLDLKDALDRMLLHL